MGWVTAYILAKKYVEQIRKKYDSNLDNIVDNADAVDGKHASDFAPAVHSHVRADITDLLPITRADLEYPTSDVSFAYLLSIDKAIAGRRDTSYNFFWFITVDAFSDKAIEGWLRDLNQFNARTNAKWDSDSWYQNNINTGNATADFVISKSVAGVLTTLASEAVDLSDIFYLCKFSVSGSTLTAYREDLTTPKISATDTDLASGYFGCGGRNNMNPLLAGFTLKPPTTHLPPAKAIVEAEVVGTGSEDDPIKPNLKEELVEISKLTNVPEFLKQEAKKYEVLRNKGFTDEEIKALLGYVPQHKVNIASVTYGFFDHKPEHNTMLITIVADNPYENAIQKQIEHAKSKNLITLKPPKDYREAVEQYKQIRRDFPEWIAGKDNYAYQTLGHEVLDCFQVADTYYGRLIEMEDKKAYEGVPNWEMRKTLEMWKERLKKVNVLKEEAEKHLKKLEEVLKKGW